MAERESVQKCAELDAGHSMLAQAERRTPYVRSVGNWRLLRGTPCKTKSPFALRCLQHTTQRGTDEGRAHLIGTVPPGDARTQKGQPPWLRPRLQVLWLGLRLRLGLGLHSTTHSLAHSLVHVKPLCFGRWRTCARHYFRWADWPARPPQCRIHCTLP